MMEDYETEHFEEKILNDLSSITLKKGAINPSLFTKYEVKRGLRDTDGRGVLVGLTEIGDVHSYILDEGEMIPVPGRLIYRGYDITDLAKGFMEDGRFGFEETVYLLLFGNLPNKKALADFKQLICTYQRLPENFARDIILNAPSKDIMNGLARSVLALYSFDANPDDVSVKNVLKQCIKLIASFPSLAAYSFQAYSHYYGNQSLVLHSPQADLGLAENILYMLRSNHKYTDLEAKLLDLALVLHAEHGGGNNSTFVTHVVTSTGTDTYAAIAAALGSLKGPRHGGANHKVIQMVENIKENVKDWEDDTEVTTYLTRLLTKDAFDHSGLIYGIGHAVYSISDPRAVVLKNTRPSLLMKKVWKTNLTSTQKLKNSLPRLLLSTQTLTKR